MDSVLHLSILILLIEFLSDSKLATFKNTVILFVCPSKISHKHCLHFLWDLVWSQEKTKAILMQNFGGTNKEYYGIFESGLCHLPLSRSCSLVGGPHPRYGGRGFDSCLGLGGLSYVPSPALSCECVLMIT